jgi:hypothetical protein
MSSVKIDAIKAIAYVRGLNEYSWMDIRTEIR